MLLRSALAELKEVSDFLLTFCGLIESIFGSSDTLSSHMPYRFVNYFIFTRAAVIEEGFGFCVWLLSNHTTCILCSSPTEHHLGQHLQELWSAVQRSEVLGHSTHSGDTP